MEFLFLRHAESEGNVQGIMQGRKEYLLSEAGHRQTRLLAQHLESNLFHVRRPDQICCSPLQRAQQTLGPWLESAGQIPFLLEPDLVEVDSGIFSGLTWAQAREQHPEICKDFKAARDWGAVPQGESKDSLWKRAERFINLQRQQHDENALLLVVTHGGFIRAALSILAGIKPSEKLFLCIDNTSLSLAGIQGERRYIRYINDTRHLQTCDYQAEFAPL
ncbi:MAG TPA: histidine phosphatase family protein [Candidatus Obscuribacterales bacterium]